MIPRLHILLGDRQFADPEAERAASRILDRLGRHVAVQLRARVGGRALYERTLRLARVADRAGGWCVVNGRVDVALAGGAQAVQLGRGSIGPEAARRCVERIAAARTTAGRTARGRAAPPSPRIGASVHGVEEARQAVSGGADFLVVGTIFATPSHPGRPGAGVGRITAVRAACANGTRRPVLAIGGIDLGRIGEVVAAGADGVVVYRAAWAEPDPVAAAEALHERIEAARAGREAGDPEGAT